MKKETVIRVVALIIVLINQLLVSLNVISKELDETTIYDMVSTFATVVMSLVTMWKNNSFTRNAQKADEYLKQLNKEA